MPSQLLAGHSIPERHGADNPLSTPSISGIVGYEGDDAESEDRPRGGCQSVRPSDEANNESVNDGNCIGGENDSAPTMRNGRTSAGIRQGIEAARLKDRVIV